MSTGGGRTRMTLYLYDAAAVASRARRSLLRGGARHTRTAGFCLYVGEPGLTSTRFDRLFAIAEARGHVA